MIHSSRRLSSRIILFMVTIICTICHSVCMMGPKTLMLATVDASNIENNNNNLNNGDKVVEKSNDANHHTVMKTTSASNHFTTNHRFPISTALSTTSDVLVAETVTSTVNFSDLEFENKSNDMSGDVENNLTEHDNETYRRLFEQLLAHPDVVLASDTFPSYSSTGPATSGTLEEAEGEDEEEESKEILYHIIIANSTSTTLPVIMVTTNSDGSQTALHRLNLTQSPSTSSPIMYSDFPTILTTKSPEILRNHDYNHETDSTRISSGSDHSAEMIVLEAHQSQQISPQQHDGENVLKLEKIASPEFLELLKSMYQEHKFEQKLHSSLNNNNKKNKPHAHHSYHPRPNHKHRHKSQEPMKMFVTSSSSSVMGGASSSDKPSLANHHLQLVEADALGGGGFMDSKFEMEKNSFTSNEIDPPNFDDVDDDNVANVNVNDQEDRYRLRNIIVVIAYSLIIIVSLFGNYLVCHVIYSTPKLRTTTNLLIFSLTISDILTTILNIPFNCARFLIKDWPFPDSFCVLMPTVQVASVYVSSLTMAAICLHRYRSILGNSTPNIVISTRLGLNQTTCSMSRIKIKMWILFIWLLSILLALPHSLFNVVVWIQQPNGQLIRRCRAHYPSSIEKQMPLFLSLLATVTQFLLPLGLTSALYIRIGRIIAHQGKLAKHYCDELNRRVVEAKRKRITMLVLIVVGFLITWFPLTLYHLLIDFHLIHFDWNQFLVLHIWAMTSVCYNPFIYCFMNEDFRKRSRQLMQRRTFPLYFCLMFNKSRLDTIRGGGHVVGGGNGAGGGAGNGRYATDGRDDYDYDDDDDDDDDDDGTSLNQGGATNQSSSSTIMSNGRMYRAQYHHQYKNHNHSIKSNQLFHHHLKNNKTNNYDKKKKNGCVGSNNFLMELLVDRNLPLRRSTSTSGSISLRTLKNNTTSTLNMITINSSNNVDDGNINGTDKNTSLERFIKYGSHQQLLAPATPSLTISITKPMPNTSSTITLEMKSQQNLNSMNDEESANNFDSRKACDAQHIQNNDDDNDDNNLNSTETNTVSANGNVNVGGDTEN